MNLEAAQNALKKYFGYDSFRPMQGEIIQAIYDKKDAVVLMPTGGGKSMCFQIPAITMPGTCVVVSPLISLMKDQVESLIGNGIRAAYLNSSVMGIQQMDIERAAVAGELQLLYVSPEKLLSAGFMGFLRSISVNLFAIDEAHCISQWGHDFRPEYTKLKFIKTNFPNIPIVALTATADKTTRKDIVNQLTLQDPRIFIASFDRPNLSLKVLPGRKKYEIIKQFIDERPNESGIIYCLSRKSTETLADKLKAAGVNAAAYHAGLSNDKRQKVQEAFIKDTVPIICATIAFGMGIDKSNVRWVIHYNLPKNMEGYYQQIGRAGRDGLPSDTILFYSYGDVIMLMKFLEESGQKKLLEAKLKRMQAYADASSCRRKILLSYFNEHLENDCGNCDICKNPPEHFDGTIIAQKALSAISRLKERVGLTMLIDVLRGSNRAEIIRNGYNKIKTYGAGANMSQNEWVESLLQLLNLGLIEVAYDDHHTLKLTPASNKVLFEGKKVNLVRFAVIQKKKAKEKQQKERTKKKTKAELNDEALFEVLRQLRRSIAEAKNVPPYVVFSDATLVEMANTKPTTPVQMRGISGVGDTKLKLYAGQFINRILSFLTEQDQQGNRVKGATKTVTLAYYKQGKSIAEIAEIRGFQDSTIVSHLVQLAEAGEDINLNGLITKEECAIVLNAVEELGEFEKLKEIFDHLEERISYGKIRLALYFQAQKEKMATGT